MTSMTCKQLGGACDKEFRENTLEEIAEKSKNHGMEMFQKGDKDHIEAMNKMRNMTQQAMMQWFEEKRKEFDKLPEQPV